MSDATLHFVLLRPPPPPEKKNWTQYYIPQTEGAAHLPTNPTRNRKMAAQPPANQGQLCYLITVAAQPGLEQIDTIDYCFRYCGTNIVIMKYD